MKKIILIAFAVFALITCKKEQKVEEIDNRKEDSLIVVEPEPEHETYAPFEVKETAEKDLANYLAPKDNDTLYITNFFATWCGPCMREIPHFKEQMNQTKDQPVKFTFINIFDTPKWNTEVKFFAESQNLSKHILLVDHEKISPNFFAQNFSTWDGSSIPFTLFKKRNQVDEYVGMMSPEVLATKINDMRQK